MKKVMAVLCLIVLAISTPAFCSEGPYMSFNIGVAMMPDYDWEDPAFAGAGLDVEYESDIGVTGGIALGYKFNNNFRIESELVYQTNDLDKVTANGVSLSMTGDSSTTAILLNGYYDFVTKGDFTPFISAGLGYAKVELNDVNFVGSGVPDASEDDTVLAYQLGCGVGYAINEQMTFDIKYRFLGTADVEIDTSEFEYGSHSIYLGLRFNF